MSDAPVSTPDDIDPESVPVNEVEDLTPVPDSDLGTGPGDGDEKDQTGGSVL